MEHNKSTVTYLLTYFLSKVEAVEVVVDQHPLPLSLFQYLLQVVIMAKTIFSKHMNKLKKIFCFLYIGGGGGGGGPPGGGGGGGPTPPAPVPVPVPAPSGNYSKKQF